MAGGAVGIFVADIIEAVPIDKYFELFKPGAGGDGGFIRIGMEYKESTPVKAGPGASTLGLTCMLLHMHACVSFLSCVERCM